MRIGMMADVYKPHISGITNYISLNKKYLQDAGHQVYVFTFGDEDYKDNEQNVIRSPGLPILDTGYYLSLRYSSEARKLIRTMDVVHIHHPFVSGSITLRYCQPRGIPTVFTNHTRYDLYAHAYLPGMPEVIGATALQAFLPTFCRTCDLVIAPSAGMRDVMQRFGVDSPVDVVPNGVDLRPFTRPPEPLDRSEFGFTENDVVLVYVGRLGPEKNLPFLLRSFAGTAEAYDHVKLMLIGGGKEADNLKDRCRHMGIQERVKFMGMVPYDQVPRYLFMADAFVTASKTEVHPLSVIEAMAAGLPVLGINSPGVGDTIQDGETGFLVREEELASFTAKLVRLVVNHDERKTMGVQASKVVEKYSINRTTEMMLEYYQGIIEIAGRRKRRLRTRMIRWLDRFR
jgi:glycosyltransferase involved in cell wall biosynthesis